MLEGSIWYVIVIINSLFYLDFLLFLLLLFQLWFMSPVLLLHLLLILLLHLLLNLLLHLLLLLELQVFLFPLGFSLFFVCLGLL